MNRCRSYHPDNNGDPWVRAHRKHSVCNQGQPGGRRVFVRGADAARVSSAGIQVEQRVRQGGETLQCEFHSEHISANLKSIPSIYGSPWARAYDVHGSSGSTVMICEECNWAHATNSVWISAYTYTANVCDRQSLCNDRGMRIFPQHNLSFWQGAQPHSRAAAHRTSFLSSAYPPTLVAPYI